MLTQIENGGLGKLGERLVGSLERIADKFADAQQPTTPAGEGGKSGGDYVPMTVETVGTHLYFYAKVNTDRCLDLIRRVRELDGVLQNEREARMLPKEFPLVPIWLHIQSGGGELFTGLNIADQLATIRTPVYSIVEGYCASAATLISAACAKRFITPSSFMLIHQLSSWAAGTYEQLQDDMHVNEMLMDRLYAFYGERTKLKVKDIKDFMRRDSWFSANECIEKGLVDEILK